MEYSPKYKWPAAVIIKTLALVIYFSVASFAQAQSDSVTPPNKENVLAVVLEIVEDPSPPASQIQPDSQVLEVKLRVEPGANKFLHPNSQVDVRRQFYLQKTMVKFRYLLSKPCPSKT